MRKEINKMIFLVNSLFDETKYMYFVFWVFLFFCFFVSFVFWCFFFLLLDFKSMLENLNLDPVSQCGNTLLLY